MSLLIRAKSAVPVVQLPFKGRSILGVRSFQHGSRTRLDIPFSKSASAKSRYLANTHSKEFSTSTRHPIKPNKTHPPLPNHCNPEDAEDAETTTNPPEPTANKPTTPSTLNTSHLTGPNPPLKIQKTPGKGHGTISTRPLPAGSILHAENPLIKSSTGSTLSISLSCHLLSTAASSYLHLLSDLHKAHPDDSQYIRIWNTNHFAIPPDLRTGCLYVKASFLNHSCEPNADYTFTEGGWIVVVAARDIGEGEEVTISYVGPEILMLGAGERRRALRGRCGFECLCEACVGGRYGMGLLDARFLMERGRAFPVERLADVHVFDVGDEESRVGAVAANQLVEEWTMDFRKRVGYWQIIIQVVVSSEGINGMFTNEVVEWMARHVVRTHTQWLQDRATIDLGTQKVDVPEEVLVPYLDRMVARARQSLLYGGNGPGLLAVQAQVQNLGVRRHEWWFECKEIVQGVEGTAGLEASGLDKEEMYRMLMDDAIEKHLKVGFGRGFMRQ
ncbi:hypothetical protein FKW77_004315 [Venturia effusa]|uniref:SET domain-containing protein n=1 Tax=Venturia effusa TaxID=50376 RepID=A0A517LIK2_9PEZI|nr:hypothetical protein FKW77_004315 [Venturia effusa]